MGLRQIGANKKRQSRNFDASQLCRLAARRESRQGRSSLFIENQGRILRSPRALAVLTDGQHFSVIG